MSGLARLGLTVALVVGLGAAAQPSLGSPPLVVHFFDVGQGDAALVVSPTGKTVLLDAGPPERAHALAARLRQLTSGPLDLAVVTHPHLDHLGGMARVLRAVGARRYLDPEVDHPSRAYRDLLRLVADQGVEYVQPRLDEQTGRFEVGLGGGATLELLWPRRPLEPLLSGTRSDVNANSLVLRLGHGAVSFLFTGDAEPQTEAHLVRRGADLQATVLKVPHHGSRHSSSAGFLGKVGASAAVISSGAGNEYGHPAPEAMRRLEAMGAQVLRTDRHGELRAESDGERVLFSWRGPSGALERLEVRPRPLPAPDPPIGRPFVASRRSEVFHLASCQAAATIAERNRLVFSTREQALAGRRPAKDCQP
jgi:competence protein ComEC